MFEIFKNFLGAFKSQPEQRRAEDIAPAADTSAETTAEVVTVTSVGVPVTKQVKKTTSKKQMFEKKEVTEPAAKKPRKPRTPKVKSE